jgi:hypothetical protein
MLATLEPPRSLWHAAPPRVEDTADVQRYSAVLEAMRLLVERCVRNVPQCEIDEYEPNKVRMYLRRFPELVSATQGMSAAGAEPIGSAGEVDARRDQIALLADLKDGTDERGVDRFGCPRGLGDILHWRSVAKIYRKQMRFGEYLAMRAKFEYRDDLAREPSDPAVAEGVCIERIARALGWFPHRCETR